MIYLPCRQSAAQSSAARPDRSPFPGKARAGSFSAAAVRRPAHVRPGPSNAIRRKAPSATAVRDCENDSGPKRRPNPAFPVRQSVYSRPRLHGEPVHLIQQRGACFVAHPLRHGAGRLLLGLLLRSARAVARLQPVDVDRSMELRTHSGTAAQPRNAIEWWFFWHHSIRRLLKSVSDSVRSSRSR